MSTKEREFNLKFDKFDIHHFLWTNVFEGTEFDEKDTFLTTQSIVSYLVRSDNDYTLADFAIIMCYDTHSDMINSVIENDEMMKYTFDTIVWRDIHGYFNSYWGYEPFHEVTEQLVEWVVETYELEDISEENSYILSETS